MQTIDEIFAILPVKLMDLKQSVKSASGKTETYSVVLSGLKVFLQGDDGDLSAGLLAGTNYTAFICQSQLGNIKISNTNQLVENSNEYDVIASLLEESSPHIAPFYQLTLEKRNK